MVRDFGLGVSWRKYTYEGDFRTCTGLYHLLIVVAWFLGEKFFGNFSSGNLRRKCTCWGVSVANSFYCWTWTTSIQYHAQPFRFVGLVVFLLILPISYIFLEITKSWYLSFWNASFSKDGLLTLGLALSQMRLLFYIVIFFKHSRVWLRIDWFIFLSFEHEFDGWLKYATLINREWTVSPDLIQCHSFVWDLFPSSVSQREVPPSYQIKQSPQNNTVFHDNIIKVPTHLCPSTRIQ